MTSVLLTESSPWSQPALDSTLFTVIICVHLLKQHAVRSVRSHTLYISFLFAWLFCAAEVGARDHVVPGRALLQSPTPAFFSPLHPASLCKFRVSFLFCLSQLLLISSLQPPCPLQISSYLIKAMPSPCEMCQDVYASIPSAVYCVAHTQQLCLHHGPQVQA